MRTADRAQALKIADLMHRSADDYGCHRDLCRPDECRGALLRDGATTIADLLRHIDGLTPMARAWAEDRKSFASLSAPPGVFFMDPAEDL